MQHGWQSLREDASYASDDRGRCAIAYWLKLLGSSSPPGSQVPNIWLSSHRASDLIQIESGPRVSMPPFEAGDDMILVAAGWRPSRVFAAVELARGPEWAEKPRWGPKWPWVLLVRPLVWFPHVADAPSVDEAGVPRSYGGAYQQITKATYDDAVRAMRQRGADARS